MKKILIIEDEPSVLENILELLEGQDYEVKGAHNGILGIEVARQFIPDLIVCDIMMPELDGYGVLGEIQKDANLSTTPFIFLTAKSELSDLRHGMELGADDYLTKPFLPDELFRTVETRLKKSEKFESKTEKILRELTLNIASTLPHELRTPLNGILASSQILMDYYDTMNQKEVQQLHENIFNSSKRLHELIVRYLSYSNIELLFNDKQSWAQLYKDCDIVNTYSLFDRIIQNLANEYDRKKDLEVDIKDSEIKINLDHLQLIIEELCSNALKFSENGSLIKIVSYIENNNFIFTIKDHGRGMTNEQIQKIGAYRQFDRKQYEQQGSGLGLISVKRLAQIYGGKITIDSKQYQYTNVTFSLPM